MSVLHYLTAVGIRDELAFTLGVPLPRALAQCFDRLLDLSITSLHGGARSSCEALKCRLVEEFERFIEVIPT